MKVSIPNSAFDEICSFLNDEECKKISSLNRWRNRSSCFNLDLNLLSDESLLSLSEHYNSSFINEDIDIHNKIRDWLSIKNSVDGGFCDDLEDFAIFLREYICNSPNYWVFHQQDDGNIVPYLVTNIKYIPACEYSPAEVKLFLFAENSIFGTSKNLKKDIRSVKTVSYHQQDLGFSIKEILYNSNLFLGTNEQISNYESEVSRYLDVCLLNGKQFLIFGRGYYVNNNWRNCDNSFSIVGDHRAVIDDRSVSVGNSTIEVSFWGDEVYCSVPLHPMLDLFSLVDHCDFKAHINQVSVYDYDKSCIDKLVLGDDIKELIMVLVNNVNVNFSDIIRGKDGGSLILCSGPPGVGKTLTAEVIAELCEKPLYRVQSNELGINCDELEKNLKNVLSRAEKWGAILLIDECDVYVRHRQCDIVQNAIVGIFLRLVEYYNGILIMTTNLGTEIDDAIVSRCSLKFDFDMPDDFLSQKKLWEIISIQNGIDLDDDQISSLVNELGFFTGRKIKNILRLGLLFSKNKNEECTLEHILYVSKYA